MDKKQWITKVLPSDCIFTFSCVGSSSFFLDLVAFDVFVEKNDLASLHPGHRASQIYFLASTLMANTQATAGFATFEPPLLVTSKEAIVHTAIFFFSLRRYVLSKRVILDIALLPTNPFLDCFVGK